MHQDTVLFGYALLDDLQHPVSIERLNRETSQGHIFYCPHCHEKMYPTFGPKYISHFRHIGQKCQFNNYLHDLAKTVFKEEFERCLLDKTPFLLELHTPAKCSRDCLAKSQNGCKKYDRVTVDLSQLYTNVTLEQRIIIDDHSRRPDILLKSDDGQQLWIEIWVTHETVLQKRDDGPIVEIKISSEKDLEQFHNHHITQSEENELAVRTFNVKYDDNTDAVQIKKHDCQNCRGYAARPSIAMEPRVHSNTTYNRTTNYYKNNTPPVKPFPQETIVPSPESTEWIDLGLPSGTLWAKVDVESQITFYNAKNRYGMNVPSKIQAEELQKWCRREWNSETKTIIMKGPNGNNISFHCPIDDTSFWLNTCERDLLNRFEYYGHCYHLFKDGSISINDKGVYSLIGLHLVKSK